MSLLQDIHRAHVARQTRLGNAPPPRVVLKPPVPKPIVATAPRPAPIAKSSTHQRDWLLVASPGFSGISVRKIQDAVCARFGIPISDLMSHRRVQKLAKPRQVAMYMTQRLTVLSLPQIGRAFAGRDHSTILHGIERIGKMRTIMPELDAELVYLEGALRSGEPISRGGYGF